MKLPIYNLDGEKTGKTINLKPEVFGVKLNEALIQEAVVAQEASKRRPVAHTKTRSERRGGGIKPWKQKGTGRARAGSRRSPLWRKGGVIFGPRSNRNFAKKINKKARAKAILMVLSDRVKSGDMIILEKMELPAAKTKKMALLLTKFPLKAKSLILLAEKNENAQRAGRNLPTLLVSSAQSLNVVQLLRYQSILMPKEAVAMIEKTYGGRAEQGRVTSNE
ncbi:50S ribosomal protein L4 [bacterium (Candidatus Torokbacteria) CG09_land_8_20_14_0_10_42_11]|nr:MAG: 50S ribosomal protein L4 [bacterium (Candidatus Torokbacteria) CG09_land_8_20_14_0_10_42_11]